MDRAAVEGVGGRRNAGEPAVAAATAAAAGGTGALEGGAPRDVFTLDPFELFRGKGVSFQVRYTDATRGAVSCPLYTCSERVAFGVSLVLDGAGLGPGLTFGCGEKRKCPVPCFVCHVSRVVRHVSCVTRHVPCAMRRVSCVRWSCGTRDASCTMCDVCCVMRLLCSARACVEQTGVDYLARVFFFFLFGEHGGASLGGGREDGNTTKSSGANASSRLPPIEAILRIFIRLAFSPRSHPTGTTLSTISSVSGVLEVPWTDGFR